jgi:Spy/CpxP family protein refolding chaperone
MKKLLFFLTPILAIGLMADTPLIQAQDRGESVSERPVHVRGRGHHGRERRGGMERMKEQLELSDEQGKKIRGLLREARKTSIKLRADLRVARIELGELVTQKKVDKAKVDAKLNEIGELSQQKLRLRTDIVLQTREVFTPGQIAKAERWLQRFVSGRGRRGRSRR